MMTQSDEHSTPVGAASPQHGRKEDVAQISTSSLGGNVSRNNSLRTAPLPEVVVVSHDTPASPTDGEISPSKRCMLHRNMFGPPTTGLEPLPRTETTTTTSALSSAAGNDSIDGGRMSPESANLLQAHHLRFQRHSLPAVTVQKPPRGALKRSSTAPEVDDDLLAPFRRRSTTIETAKIEHVETNTEETVNQYRILGKIGEGSFGIVCKAEAVNTGEEVAIKVLSKSRLTKLSKRKELAQSRRLPPRNGMRGRPAAGRGAPAAAPATPDPLAQVKREIAILKNLDHPRVINLFEVMDDPEEDNLFMVFELMKNGSVMDDDLSETFDEETSLSYFIDLMLGVEYLHAQNIAHRDIKPQNLLLDNSKEHIKITDFGVSEWFSAEGSEQSHQAGAGSPAFMAPETLQDGVRGSKTDFDAKKADIWAMGVTLYCFVCGKLPFQSKNLLELHELIKAATPEFPESCDISEDLRDFILKLLEKDPAERMTISEMKNHPWIRQVPNLPSVEENCGAIEEVTDEEIAAAFSSMSIADLESLLISVAGASFETLDGSIDYASEPFLSLRNLSRQNSQGSQASGVSGHASQGGSPEATDFTPEQESIIQRLAMARRPSFTEQRWSPSPYSPRQRNASGSPLVSPTNPRRSPSNLSTSSLRAESPSAMATQKDSDTSPSPTPAPAPEQTVEPKPSYTPGSVRAKPAITVELPRYDPSRAEGAVGGTDVDIVPDEAEIAEKSSPKASSPFSPTTATRKFFKWLTKQPETGV